MSLNDERRGWPENAIIGTWHQDDNIYRFHDGVLEFQYCGDYDAWEESDFGVEDAGREFRDWMDSLLPPPDPPAPTFWSAADMATVKHAMAQASGLMDEVIRITRSESAKAVAEEAKKVMAEALEDVST